MFNIIEKRKIMFAISLVIIAAGIVSFFIQGFNLGIDFAGGTTMHISLKTEVNADVIDKVSAAVEATSGQKPSSVVATGDGTEVIIKTKEMDTKTRDDMFDAIKGEFKLEDADRLAVDNVSASVGKDLKRSAFLSTIIAAALMLIYITFRFEYRTAVSAVACLLHDVLIVLSFYSILQLPMNITFIAAILTILGYSINATIVVFDRIRENRKLKPRANFAEIVNQSIWQTMTRSINTSLTTVLVIVVLFVLGVPAIKEFSLPIIVGIVAGTFSSVFLAGNFWVILRTKMGKTN